MESGDPEQCAGARSRSSSVPVGSGDNQSINDALQQEEDFLEYLMSQKPAAPPLLRSVSGIGGGGGGMDHLDSLCKLMEQLGDLREQNCKLQRRVQYLEDLKNLQAMQRQLSAKRHLHRRIVHQTFPTPITASRDQPEQPPPKVSKWTKVKEAFKWEKAIILPEAKSQDSGIGSCHLRPPPVTTGEDSSSGGHSPQPLTELPSSSSSSEDLEVEINLADSGPQRSASATDSTGGRLLEQDGAQTPEEEQEEASRRSKSLDGDASVLLARNKLKGHKTPWGKVKDIIQTRKDSLKKRQDHEDDPEELQQHRPVLTLTLPSTEELRKPPPSPQSEDRIHKVSMAEPRASKWTKVKKAFLTSAGPSSPNRNSSFFEDELDVQAEIQKNYEELQHRLSQEFHRKLDKRDPDLRRKLQEWHRIKKESPGVCRKQKLQWLEKELTKIEREKQRLEREREKYLEREARLEKMRRAMSKQEVLIQTSTGFFRFQGISEKFTRRLYEWEKARGIGPEASTFALLDPGYRPSSSSAVDGVMRSKSASSVSNLGSGAVTNVGTSSLSLNDVEVLEQVEALGDSRAASEPHLRTADDDEPEAMIVDVEDVIEETAAPLLATPAVQSETPVYCYAPEEVTRLIDSSGSENSYRLLEENLSLIHRLQHKEDICRRLEDQIDDNSRQQQLQKLCLDEQADEGTLELELRQERLMREGETLQDSFAEHSEQQAELAQSLVGKMKQLRASCDAISLVQDLSSQLLQLAEKLESALAQRNREIREHPCPVLPRQSSEELTQLPSLLTNKVLELKEGLNVLCQASSEAPASPTKKEEEDRLESRDKDRESYCSGGSSASGSSSECDDEEEEEEDEEDEHEAEHDNVETEVVKTITVEEESESDESEGEDDCRQRRVVKTRQVLPTPENVFVKTTRKIFSPVRRDSKGKASSVISYVVDEPPPAAPSWMLSRKRSQSSSPALPRKSSSETDSTSNSDRPPVQQSPGPARRVVTPNIRMMIAKYNQKLEGPGGETTGGGSSSPVAWRSPVAERRVRAQMEKYQEEVRKCSEVQKSASAGLVNKPPTRGILKSFSVGAIKSAPPIVPEPSPSPADSSSPPPSRLRAIRLQKAKEEFLTRGPGGQSWTSEIETPSASVSPEPVIVAPTCSLSPESVTVSSSLSVSPELEVVSGSVRGHHVALEPLIKINNMVSSEPVVKRQLQVASEPMVRRQIQMTSEPVVRRQNKMTSRNIPDAGPSRLSQASMDEEEGILLVKSASAGMINVDPQACNATDNKVKSSGKFGIASLTSRFRRVKMRKKEKMNTVSTLCRQSLLVDLHLSKGNAEPKPGPSTSKSCPSSPVLQRSASGEKHSSWIFSPARKIFKPK